MKPEKFKKICEKYLTAPDFIVEDCYDSDGTLTVSVFYKSYGVLRCLYKDKEKPCILLANKFKYSEYHGKILPCKNDGTFIATWDDFKKLYNVGHNNLIKIIFKMIEKIKIAQVEHKKQLIEKDFENEG